MEVGDVKLTTAEAADMSRSRSWHSQVFLLHLAGFCFLSSTNIDQDTSYAFSYVADQLKGLRHAIMASPGGSAILYHLNFHHESSSKPSGE